MCAAKAELEYAHKIYKSDPLSFKNYVGKEVNIVTESGSTCTGVVYTIDPVSESVILLQLSEKTGLKVVLGHAIKSIEVIKAIPENDLPELFTSLPKQITPSALEERKAAVREFLMKNRFPVKEDKDVLLIQDVAALYPPYEPENCVSSNSIVLGRIQTLLGQIKA